MVFFFSKNCSSVVFNIPRLPLVSHSSRRLQEPKTKHCTKTAVGSGNVLSLAMAMLRNLPGTYELYKNDLKITDTKPGLLGPPSSAASQEVHPRGLARYLIYW